MIRSDFGGEDGFCWRISNNGMFSVKTAYNASMPNQTSNLDGTWKIVWKLQLAQKICTFIWMLFHGKILTNLERMRRIFMNDPYCHCCPQDLEDRCHLFRNYTKVKPFWQRVMIEEEKKGNRILPFKEWLRWNLTYRNPRERHMEGKIRYLPLVDLKVEE